MAIAPIWTVEMLTERLGRLSSQWGQGAEF